MKKEEEKKNPKKKPYSAPVIEERTMTGFFMVCSNPVAVCPPGTRVKQLTKCF